MTLQTGTDSRGVFTLLQDGHGITGTAVLPSGGALLLGTAYGDNFRFTTFAMSPSFGSFEWIATVSPDGSSIFGDFGGYDCAGLSGGAMSATKR